jgi:hypothetical protein
MSGHQQASDVFDPIMQPFFNYWSDYAQQANQATREMLGGIDETVDFKNWQRRWSEAVSQSADAFLRSPMFLEAMKQNIDLAVKTKMHADDLATEFARNANIPTAGDISGLFERLHSIEVVILDRLNRIDNRLQLIEDRIGMAEVTS